MADHNAKNKTEWQAIHAGEFTKGTPSDPLREVEGIAGNEQTGDLLTDAIDADLYSIDR